MRAQAPRPCSTCHEARITLSARPFRPSFAHRRNLRSGLAQTLCVGEKSTALPARERSCATRREVSQRERAEAHPHEAPHWVPQGRQRPANLALASLPDGEMERGLPVVSVDTHAGNPGGCGGPVLKRDAPGEARQCVLSHHPPGKDEVLAFVSERGMKQRLAVR